MTGNRTKAGTDQLEGAYALETPADNVDYYRDFARTYDEGFVRDTGYVYPRLVAELFLVEAGPEDSPVLDVGAGTGLVAEHLAGCTVDAIDISPEMLEKAAAKGLYRNRVAADRTQPLELPDAAYGGRWSRPAPSPMAMSGRRRSESCCGSAGRARFSASASISGSSTAPASARPLPGWWRRGGSPRLNSARSASTSAATRSIAAPRRGGGIPETMSEKAVVVGARTV